MATELGSLRVSSDTHAADGSLSAIHFSAVDHFLIGAPASLRTRDQFAPLEAMCPLYPKHSKWGFVQKMTFDNNYACFAAGDLTNLF